MSVFAVAKERVMAVIGDLRGDRSAQRPDGFPPGDRHPDEPRPVDGRYTEQPEHKHLEDHRFGRKAAAREQEVDRMMDESDGDPAHLDAVDDDASGRGEPHAGGRA